jgi:hypothetical protein
MSYIPCSVVLVEGMAEVAAAAIEGAVDALTSLRLDQLSDAEVTLLWERVEVAKRRLEVVDQDLIEQVRTRGIAPARGYPSPTTLMIDLLRVSPAEATARVRASGRFGPQRALSGELVERIYPTVSAAQATGAVSAAHAKVIADTIEQLPDDIAAAHDREIEAILTAQAHELDPRRLATAARRLTCAPPH